MNSFTCRDQNTFKFQLIDDQPKASETLNIEGSITDERNHVGVVDTQFRDPLTVKIAGVTNEPSYPNGYKAVVSENNMKTPKDPNSFHILSDIGQCISKQDLQCTNSNAANTSTFGNFLSFLFYYMIHTFKWQHFKSYH